MKTNKKSLSITIISLLLLSILIFATSFCILPQNIVQNDQLTKSKITTTTDDPYFSETTYYYDEEEYNSVVNSHKENIVLESASKNDDKKQFAFGVTKTVYVEDTFKDNVKVGSRLLTSAEMRSVPPYWPMGSDTTTKESLTISFSVFFTLTDIRYILQGNAIWNSQLIYGGEKNPEDSADDFFGISWGGGGELKQISKTFNGNYRDGTSVPNSRTTSDSYAGYCWQFREKTGLITSAMDRANIEVQIQKTYAENQKKETCAKLTYIHTWNKIQPTVSIKVGGSPSLSASFGLSTQLSSWQIEVDVPGLIH